MFFGSIPLPSENLSTLMFLGSEVSESPNKHINQTLKKLIWLNWGNISKRTANESLKTLQSYLVQSLKRSLQASCCSLSVHWAIMASATSGTWSSDCTGKKHMKSRWKQWISSDCNSDRESRTDEVWDGAGRCLCSSAGSDLHVHAHTELAGNIRVELQPEPRPELRGEARISFCYLASLILTQAMTNQSIRSTDAGQASDYLSHLAWKHLR